MPSINRPVDVVREFLDKELDVPNSDDIARKLVLTLVQEELIASVPDIVVHTPQTNSDWAAQYRGEWDWVPDIEFWGPLTTFWVNIDGKDTNGGFQGEPVEEFTGLSAEHFREIAAISFAVAKYLETVPE